MLGVCHSLFWNSSVYDADRDALDARLFAFLDRGNETRLEIVYLDRECRDLYQGRSLAETGGDGADLLLDTRISLNCYVLPLYFRFLFHSVDSIARSDTSEPANERLERQLRRFYIGEASLAPTLSTVMVDDSMFVSPYLAADCFSEPCIEYQRQTPSGEIADDWEACRKHYAANREHAKSFISEKLIQAVAAHIPEVTAAHNREVGDDPIDSADLHADEEGPYERLIRTLYDQLGVPISERSQGQAPLRASARIAQQTTANVHSG